MFKKPMRRNYNNNYLLNCKCTETIHTAKSNKKDTHLLYCKYVNVGTRYFLLWLLDIENQFYYCFIFFIVK